MASKPPVIPFVPKSTSFLKPGMFWDIPLRDGSYACGRVLCIEGKHRKRRSNLFWGGLLRWHGSVAPTMEGISGAPVLWQGDFNVRSFKDSGSRILGLLPLEADDLEIPPLLTTTLNGEVMIGYDVLRPATNAEYRSLPVKTVQVSNDSFREIADEVFLDGKPLRWDRSPDENALLDSLGLKTPADLKEVEARLSREWRASKRARAKK
ncbi:Imm26 family immunity protein [Roseibacillus persicicus]|uniref:Imm26 family immunity protein n=1 Tax=Roseibacillus persicicus TaxID=454148 RepID=UPI00398AD919